MRHPARKVFSVVSSVLLINLCTCGSSNPGPTDGGPNLDGGQNLVPDGGCSVQGLPGQGIPCYVELTGALDAELKCTNFGFAVYDPSSKTTSVLNIGSNVNSAGVRLVAIDLSFKGTPDSGTPDLIAGNGGPGPNNITIIDTGYTTYYTSYTGSPGQMSVTLTYAEEAMNTDGGASNLYCIHGFVTADVPKLSPGAPTIVHLDAGF